MIKLDVQDYCKDCLHFEADVDKYSTFKGDVVTRIQCEKRQQCHLIYEYIKKNLEASN